jgi:hypothetical protein
MEILSKESVEFGKMPASPTKQGIEIAEKLLSVVKDTSLVKVTAGGNGSKSD